MKEDTHFAPADRSPYGKIIKDYELIGSQKFFTEIFGALTGIGAVIDENRQIVFANDEFLDTLGILTIESVLGKRPGEIISCLNSGKEISGCGTAEECAYCGAVNAILESQNRGVRVRKETRITSSFEGKIRSWDLKITCTPITLAGVQFYVLVLQDISDEKRRFALERIFFHDLLNTAGAINSLITIIKDGTAPEEEKDLLVLAEEASNSLVEEILHHRQILAAETGDLRVMPVKLSSREFLTSVVEKIIHHDAAKGKSIVIEEASDDVAFESDTVLLQRVFINLIKNALEATPEEGTVKAGSKASGTSVVFWVQNSGVIAKEVQMQIFQRSFTTKGKGRGIGTYSVRLLTENYLNGKISFVSNEYEGTIFMLELNARFSENSQV